MFLLCSGPRKALTGETPSAPSVIYKPRPPSSGLGGVGLPDDQPPTTIYIYSRGDIYICEAPRWGLVKPDLAHCGLPVKPGVCPG